MAEQEKLKQLLSKSMELLSEARPGLFLKAEIAEFRKQVELALTECTHSDSIGYNQQLSYCKNCDKIIAD